jgi:ketosteroid isomerase-like protein
MKASSPFEAITQFIDAMRQGNLDAALNMYEPYASFVAQPGVIVTGIQSLREALAGFAAMKPVLSVEAYQVVEAGDIALYCSRWNLQAIDQEGKPVEMSGQATNVLRRQPSGNWLIAVDNPWGTGIVA